MKAVHAHYKTTFGVPQRVDSYKRGSTTIDTIVFDSVPCPGARMAITAGMAPVVGQELIVAGYDRFLNRDATRLLASVAEEVMTNGTPVRRGQIFGPAGPLLASTQLEALYACAPTYFPESLEPLTLGDRSHVHFLWLIPIARAEASWILANDTSALLFEDALEREDPDLLDLTRPPLGACIPTRTALAWS